MDVDDSTRAVIDLEKSYKKINQLLDEEDPTNGMPMTGTTAEASVCMRG